MTDTTITDTLAIIRQRAPNFKADIGIILGSGAGKFSQTIVNPITIPYTELPSMRKSGVEGHAGVLQLGCLQNHHVACFNGRNHLYEGHPAAVVTAPIRILKQLGAKTVILGAAVGSLNPHTPPGSLVMINDHINFQFSNPLVGPNDDTLGVRFPSLEHAYDLTLRQQLAESARELALPLTEGVYIACLGPSFETPAEIRAFKYLGADVVGMSLVPEVIAARHCGLNVLAIAMVTNLAVGLSSEIVDHQMTLTTAAQTVADLTKLLLHFLERNPHD